MKQVIDGLLYNTETVTLIADDRFWDGHNWERHGRNTSLYKTKKGAYFLEHTTFWQGERDHLEAILTDETMWYFERLPCQKVE